MKSNHFIILNIAVNDEVGAVEDFIDVGNVLGKSWVCLSVTLCIFVHLKS